MNLEYEFKYLKKFSKDIGIPKINLVEAFKIEKDFHIKILKEYNRQKRKQMYEEVYEKVHPIYGKSSNTVKKQNLINRKIRFFINGKVLLFRKELEGKSILDVGCGDGHFLINVANRLNCKRLVGIDISTSVLPKAKKGIDFIKSDIVDFDLGEKFDLVLADQVLEHIAPLDLPITLSLIRKALKKNGTLIILMPNRLFGPSDVSRIIDYTYTNQVSSMGTHLNESTYSEMISILKRYNFKKFYTVIPFLKLRYFLPWVRLNPYILTYVENNRWLLKIFYKIKLHSSCIARFDIILICK